MGSDITLSKAVRGNLLSLQSTSDLLTKTQERLSTGLKVNSALDNPTNFFTASSLNSRASDLSRLLDSVGNATQTLEAADNGISAITDLVEAAQATARQALQTSAGITGGTTTEATVTGTGAAIGADDAAVLTGTAALTGTDGTSTLASDGDSFEISVGSDTYTFDFFDSGSAAYAGSNVGIDIEAATDIDDALVQINAALAADGNSAALNGGNIEFTAGDTADTITVDPNANSTAGVLTALGLTSGDTADATNTDLAALAGDDLTIDVGGASFSYTFAADSTKADLDTQLAAFVSGNAGVAAASADASGNLTVTAAEETDSITLGGTALTSFGTDLTTTATDPVTTGGTNRREDLETDFNELLVQIDELKNDAGFNGKNLLDGDDLKVVFNEDGSSSLNIGGVTFDSAGLGLSAVAAGDFDTDANIEATLSTLDTATSTLRSQASKFGSNLSVVETRESFTKETINTLETGAANLTLADLNEEGANLLSLQTRQSLSSTALSLASQADQNVLRLL
ncbi:MAG: flagellin [Alphaproteobacteria bacterium]